MIHYNFFPEVTPADGSLLDPQAFRRKSAVLSEKMARHARRGLHHSSSSIRPGPARPDPTRPACVKLLMLITACTWEHLVEAPRRVSPCLAHSSCALALEAVSVYAITLATKKIHR